MSFSGRPVGGVRAPQAAPEPRPSFARLKEEHRRQKRAAITAAAAEVFARRGFRSATVADVARAAGITAGTIYLYFSSKEDLLFATVLAEIDDLEHRMRDVPTHGPVPAVLKRMMEVYFDFYVERPNGFQMLMAGLGESARSRASDELIRAYDQRATACLALLREVLERGIAEGSLLPADADQLTVAVWGACHGILQLAAGGGNQTRFVGLPVRELFSRTCDALLHGIAIGA